MRLIATGPEETPMLTHQGIVGNYLEGNAAFQQQCKLSGVSYLGPLHNKLFCSACKQRGQHFITAVCALHVPIESFGELLPLVFISARIIQIAIACKHLFVLHKAPRALYVQGIFSNLSGIAAKVLDGLARTQGKPQEVGGPSGIPQGFSDKRRDYALKLPPD